MNIATIIELITEIEPLVQDVIESDEGQALIQGFESFLTKKNIVIPPQAAAPVTPAQ